jgi:hypothetical protein
MFGKWGRIRSEHGTKGAGWKGNGKKEENEEETYIVK